MQKHVVNYLRFVAFSVVALGLSACMKIAPSDGVYARPEPLFGDPPKSAAETPKQTDAQRLAALEAQVETIDTEIANLKKALEVMGPLPDHADMFVPTSQAEIDGDVAPTDPETVAAARLARLYAAPPRLNNARSLFYEAELGSFGSRALAQAGWEKLATGNKLAGLSPRFSTAGPETRLLAGPLASEAAVETLCVELSALAGACRVAAPIRAY
ncbi:MAG TPA: SPOR domain-containing protein [Hyphomonadaceae bacterium]|nr:SPOR domain-containing protein [Hyphomonadaceae bacterium]